MSLAVTDLEGAQKHHRKIESKMRTQITVIETSRVYVSAVKHHEGDPAYVALPRKLPGHRHGLCGLLRAHMYGGRAAADGWLGE